MTFEQLVAYTREVVAVRVWKVAVLLPDGKASHASIHAKSAEDAIAIARTFAHVQPWTLAHDAIAEEHPAFKPAEAPPPATPASAELLEVAPEAPHFDDDEAAPAPHFDDAAEQPTRDDRAVPVTRR